MMISACAFDRGGDNVRVDLIGQSSWSDTAPVLHSKTHAPTTVEYDIEFPVDASYVLSVRAAAAQARPVEVFFDGTRVASCCRETTGGWNASQAKWEKICGLRATKGKHTIKLFRELGFPHIVALRFDSSVPFPKGWRPPARAIARSVIPTEPSGPLVFVLAGQSNMVGQGVLAELPEPLRELPENVTLCVQGRRMTLVQQGHFGPEVGIAQRIASQYPDRKIVLFKFAVNGASTLAWSPEYDAAKVEQSGNQHDRRAGPCYENFMAAWRQAFEADKNRSPDGFFWMQGESDARFPLAGEQHRSSLRRIITSFRKDLRAPNAPFFLGEVNPPQEKDFALVERVVANMRELADELPRVYTVSTFGVGKKEDAVHYDTAGQLELGRRFARMFLVTLPRNRPGPLNLPLEAPQGFTPYCPTVNPAALRRAIRDLIDTFAERYPRGNQHLARLDRIEKELAGAKGDAAVQRLSKELEALHNEALLANPLLEFKELLLVKRRAGSPDLGLPHNFNCNVAIPSYGFGDEIVVLSLANPAAPLRTVFKPIPGRFVGDVDLHFDADRLLFSMRDDNGMWQVYEIGADGGGLHALTGEQPDVHSFDACYLPDGGVVFCSTAYFNAIPCTGGDSAVLYRMDADGKNIRQLCFDQDQNWCPTVMNDGRILYTRWEYADTPHTHARLLFRMNPDGTEQMEFYGSNSYWPNAFFFARPIPGHPSKVISVIGGHHGAPRVGELVIFDPALGRREASGAVQRIPGWGRKPQRVMKDQLVDGVWPRFLHPWPLSDPATDFGAGKYFLVACQPTPASHWGVYLADVFDNLVLIKELPGYALLEPIPLRPRRRPPVIPPRFDPQNQSATVYISDIHGGNGLRDIPRGAVKALRLVTYSYTYPGVATVPGVLGIDGPWDIKRVLGTVPVEPDGSALFRVPANTPISLQPLDEQGRALQLMRSWYTAMPGEVVSCAGCHESRNTPPANRAGLALRKPPAEIRPWRGPTRGFSFQREVQPVIDRYCVECHDGQPRDDGTSIPDLRGVAWRQFDSHVVGNSQAGNGTAAMFLNSYTVLQRLVRRPGHENDLHMLEPMEFHADTTELVQMLRKGHHGVGLDEEAWDRLVTWIDLNCPFYGTHLELRSKHFEQVKDRVVQGARRRRELLQRYAGTDDNPQVILEDGAGIARNSGSNGEPPRAAPARETAEIQAPAPTAAGWPFDADEAARRQSEAGPFTRRKLALGDGLQIDLVLIPPGEFVMGGTLGALDEHPAAVVRIERPFWMSAHEITNAQFAQFDPTHDSRVEVKPFCQYGVQGFPVDFAEQPAVRVSWDGAMAFCRWLSDKTGMHASLPTEAQWEYACRAGAATQFFYGDLDADFSLWANVADAKLSRYVTDVWSVYDPPSMEWRPTEFDDYIPKDKRFNDRGLISEAPGRHRPNPWGLFDMHGNVAEWTRSTYRPYPYDQGDGRDDPNEPGLKVVRGGSWRDRPHRCTSSFRLAYQPYQRVFNVGFRVVCEAGESRMTRIGAKRGTGRE